MMKHFHKLKTRFQKELKDLQKEYYEEGLITSIDTHYSYRVPVEVKHVQN